MSPSLPVSKPSPLPRCRRPACRAGHLQDLTDRARGYVEAATSVNTRRAYERLDVIPAQFRVIVTALCRLPQ
ncbi:hypothetical protein J2X76_005409 [Neorhizobium sp. 2083]|nr:hypothetical protein [Neorhizobium sp. 2083]